MAICGTRILNEAVDEFLSASLAGEEWTEALEGIAKATGVTGAVLMSYRGHRLTASLPSSGLSLLYERFNSGDAPFCSRLKKVVLDMSEGFRFDHDNYTDAELASDLYYQDFLRPLGSFWNAVVKLAPGPINSGLELGLKRELSAGPFTEEERATLDALLPRLRSAARITLRMQESRAEGFVQALTNQGDLIFELNASGQVREAYGHGVGQTEWPLAVIGHRLVATDHLSQRGLDRAVQAAIASPSRPAIASLMAPDGSRRFVHVVPIKGRAHDVFLGTAAIAILFYNKNIDLAQINIDFDFDVLRDIFSLTKREAEVVSLLVRGMAPVSIARHLHIGLGTVRTYLKGAFQKTSTTGQRELVALVLGNIGQRI